MTVLYLLYILAYIQHSGDVSLANWKPSVPLGWKGGLVPQPTWALGKQKKCHSLSGN